MAAHIIRVVLSEKEEALLKAMAKDNTYGTADKKKVLESIFYLQLREDMDILYEELCGGVK